MQIVRCWATPTNKRYDPTYTNILDNGCPLTSKSPAIPNLKIILNGESDKARIGFSAVSFKGGDIETIFLRCLINLCDKTKNNDCAKSCSDKANPSDGSVLHGDVYLKVLTSSPIAVRDICGGTNKGGCDHYCSVSSDNKPVCTCHQGFELGSDKKSCKIKNRSSPIGRTVPWYYYVPVILGVFLIIIAIVIIYRRRKKESGLYKVADLDKSDAGEGDESRFLS
uniref:ZP domain-containing protein n=1 Tax=Ciona savignyi TaxID=51511 RepID=H2Y495_CIOSA